MPEDSFVPPEEINGFHIRKIISSTEVMYAQGDDLCVVRLESDGRWGRHYGRIKPCGVNFKNEYVSTREEAFSNLVNPHKRK